MNIKIKKISSFNRQMSLKIPWKDLEPDFNVSMKQFSKKIKLPGFRAGKIPRKVLMSKFLTSIEADFIESSINKYYLNALKEEQIYPINKGSISDVKFKFENDLEFKVEFEIEPDIKLPKWKKNLVPVEKPSYVSDEEDVKMALEEAQRNNAEIKSIDDGSKKDDFIICDLQEVDTSGVPIIGKKLETRYVRIGQTPFDGNNQKKLTGLKQNDKVVIDVPINESGDLGRYELTVKNVERQILPKIDNKLVKIVDPESKNLSDYKKRIKVRIDESYQKKADEIFENNIIDALVKKIDPICPSSMLDSYLSNILEDLEKNGNNQLDPKKAKQTYKPIAEKNIKWYLIRNALLKEQGFKIESKELESEIKKLKSQNKSQASDVEKHFQKNENKKRLQDSLLEKKIIDFLIQYVKAKDVKILTKDLRKNATQRVQNG